MSFVSKCTLTFAIVVFGSLNSATADDRGILEFEGRQTVNSRELHFSYIFLPSQRVIVQFSYDSKGQINGIGHGTYSKKKDAPFEIRWHDGGNEKGNFDSKGNYKIIDHTDKAQRGITAKGRLQYLKDPKRMEQLVTYVQKVIAPLLRHRAALRKQLQEIEHMQFKTSMEILKMWSTVP